MGNWFADLFREQILAQVLAYVVPLVVTVVIGWAGVLYAKVTGREIDKQNRDSLETALSNAVRWAIQELLNGKLTPQGTVPEGEKAKVIAAAKQYVKTSAPGALRHFKMSNAKLDERVKSKLPLPGEMTKKAA
jgi:hypothetical protein